ncbi:hypothetical protein SNEBB_006088 [Seison nebaliae]|nr:hypothetical protein SNEBB_006088 [Seison nebaliae]
MSLSRPAEALLRRPLYNTNKKHVLFCAVACAIAGCTWRYFMVEGRDRRIEEFYATYDQKRDYERMKAAGVFKSTELLQPIDWVTDYEKKVDDAIAQLKN